MPDERVQAAMANWAPRFVAQGVDYNDFVRTTARMTKWEDWCREWCATGDLHADLGAKAEAKGNTISAGEAYVAAALCYHFGKYLFQDKHDEYAAAAFKSIQTYAKGAKLLDPTTERIEVPLPPAQGTTSTEPAMMVGILRRPQGASRPPLVLLFPGLDSVKEEFFYWEEVFLKRGLATFSLDGPGQGECGFHSHIRADYEVAVSAVLEVLCERSDIDTHRIGAAGVSMGGYYAPRAAAFDGRIKAAVENCGAWNFGECWGSLPGLTRAAFRYHSGARDETDAQARAAKLTLEGVAHRIKQPLLVIHGKLDRLIPWEQALKIVSGVGPNAELALFENGNHVCNNIPFIYRPLTVDWLKEKLG